MSFEVKRKRYNSIESISVHCNRLKFALKTSKSEKRYQRMKIIYPSKFIASARVPTKAAVIVKYYVYKILSQAIL